MTTTTKFEGMEPGAKNSSRVLRPPGGGSNISFGTEEEKPVRVNKMASSVFAEPEDPYANPHGKHSGNTEEARVSQLLMLRNTAIVLGDFNLFSLVSLFLLNIC
uniref:Jupiter microtubule associated homolog 1a n=1 Tax=Neogobius melanostomus TaxID=47308 RepID=A0A8C6WK93_9GOBI